MLFFKNNKQKIRNDDIIKASLYGFLIGDALGVPVEFVSRQSLKNQKVTTMLQYGTHYQPKGTWSDDSSMMLATIDGLLKSSNNINYQLIMSNFLSWKQNGEFTPFNSVFDIGNSTSLALTNYQKNVYNNEPENVICGNGDISSNGNGSLMRILPISLYLYYSKIDYKNPKFMEIINTISSMTHSHIYSVFGCYIYSLYVSELINEKDKYIAYKNLQNKLKEVYEQYSDIGDVYNRIIFGDISKLKENDIKSSGYVVDSLEACIWSVLTSSSYEEAVLRAVNLGDDTDTIGALTGALSGIIFGYDDIPKEWINSLQKKDYLDDMINKFDKYLKSLDKKIDIKILKEVLEDLENNPNSCTIESGMTSNDGSFTIGESSPGEKLQKFIKYIGTEDLIDKDYIKNYELIKDKNIDEYTYDEVLTDLTRIIRGDRFVSGLIYSSFKDGTLLKLTKRLYDLNTDDSINILKCPICGGRLMFMMPDGTNLGCVRCDKYFINKNGVVGDEITDPYPDHNAIY